MRIEGLPISKRGGRVSKQAGDQEKQKKKKRKQAEPRVEDPPADGSWQQQARSFLGEHQQAENDPTAAAVVVAGALFMAHGKDHGLLETAVAAAHRPGDDASSVEFNNALEAAILYYKGYTSGAQVGE